MQLDMWMIIPLLQALNNETYRLSNELTFIVDIEGPEEQVFVTDETKLSCILVSIPNQQLCTWDMTITFE